MINGIGCDVVEHQICKNLKWDSDEKILVRIFSSNEIKLYSITKDLKFLAGRFAAKEAILKCLGTGMSDGISLIDIEILKSQNNKPIIKLHGLVKKIAYELGMKKWHISISHTTSSSTAFIIGES